MWAEGPCSRAPGTPDSGDWGEIKTWKERNITYFSDFGALSWAPTDLCFSPALIKTCCVTLGQLFDLFLLNSKEKYSSTSLKKRDRIVPGRHEEWRDKAIFDPSSATHYGQIW